MEFPYCHTLESNKQPPVEFIYPHKWHRKENLTKKSPGTNAFIQYISTEKPGKLLEPRFNNFDKGSFNLELINGPGIQLEILLP